MMGTAKMNTPFHVSQKAGTVWVCDLDDIWPMSGKVVMGSRNPIKGKVPCKAIKLKHGISLASIAHRTCLRINWYCPADWTNRLIADIGIKCGGKDDKKYCRKVGE
jgi:hypothetical protein